jgi:hypothetical protein
MNLYFYSFSPIVISDTSISSIKALRSDQFSLVKGGIVVLIVIILVVFLLIVTIR